MTINKVGGITVSLYPLVVLSLEKKLNMLCICPRLQNEKTLYSFVPVIGRFRLLSQENFEEYLAAQGGSQFIYFYMGHFGTCFKGIYQRKKMQLMFKGLRFCCSTAFSFSRATSKQPLKPQLLKTTP